MSSGSEQAVTYFVVRNAEEQYSVWPSYRPVPMGWEVVGDARPKDQCLDYIESVWTDMRPKSVRQKFGG